MEWHEIQALYFVLSPKSYRTTRYIYPPSKIQKPKIPHIEYEEGSYYEVLNGLKKIQFQFIPDPSKLGQIHNGRAAVNPKVRISNEVTAHRPIGRALIAIQWHRPDYGGSRKFVNGTQLR